MAEMNIQRNARVIAADGEVGSVRHVVVDPGTKEVTHLVVDNGDQDQMIPVTSVASVEGDRVTLKGGRSQVNASARAFDREHYHAIEEETARQETTRQAERGGAPLVDAAKDQVQIAGSQTPPAQRPVQAERREPGAAATPQSGTEQPYRLQLREERLRVQKQQEQAGEVTLGKRVTEHTETVNVPLREERVVIERTPGSGQPVAGATLKDGETIEVPVMRETATTEKEAVVTEEVTARKEVTERQERVSDTVRKEELVVEGDQKLVDRGTGGDTPPRRS